MISTVLLKNYSVLCRLLQVCFYRATLWWRGICCRVSVRPSVRPSVRHKPVLYRNHWTNRTGFWQGGFLRPIPHCVIRKYGCPQKLGYFPPGPCPKLRTSPPQVDRVVNKTRRRRRSSFQLRLVVDLLSNFWLRERVARSLCGSRASCLSMCLAFSLLLLFALSF